MVSLTVQYKYILNKYKTKNKTKCAHLKTILCMHSSTKIPIQYNAIQFNAIQYSTIQFDTLQYNNTIQYSVMLYNTLHYTTYYGMKPITENMLGGVCWCVVVFWYVLKCFK